MADTICGRLTANALASCDDPLVMGLWNDAVLINFDDWITATIGRNGVNARIIESILLNGSPAPSAFKVQAINNAHEAETSMVQPKYSLPTWEQSVILRISGNDPDYKLRVEELATGRFVLIMKNMFDNENKATPSDSIYEVYGVKYGLMMKPGSVHKTTDADTQGGYICTLACSDDHKEPHLPDTLYKTSKAATEAIVQGLL
jgi:hypothetical protein